MTDETPSPNDNPDHKPEMIKGQETTKGKVIAGTKKTVEVVEKVGATAEVASNAFGMVKWVAIAVVTLSLLGGGYAVYKTVMKPVEAMGNAAGAVVETVGDGVGAIAEGAGSVVEGAGNVINRLDIAASNQSQLDARAEKAFPILFKMQKTKADSIREGVFRRTNFGDSEGKICKSELTFGEVPVVTYSAADVKAHETSAELGSRTNRMIRMIIRTSKDDLKFNTVWNEASEQWQMKWSKTTLSKEAGDQDAEKLILNILAAIAKNCQS